VEHNDTELASYKSRSSVLGSLAFYGGGDNGGYPYQTFNAVDIFNATIQTWSTATMRQNRTWLVAASIRDIVAFGGGTLDNGANYLTVVDVYNATSSICALLVSVKLTFHL
jgi:hypothetical protein